MKPNRRARHAGSRATRGGFTLIELLITVAVLAILMAIAVPMYSGYTLRAKRAEAKRAISEAAQLLERNYTNSGCYKFSTPAECAAKSGTLVSLPTVLQRAPAEGKGSYAVSVAFATDGQGFTLTAAPCGASGVDCTGFSNDGLKDAECGNFTLDNTGARGLVVGGGAVTDATLLAKCWQR
jgi:type IV pilus assembly protein PilE